MRGIEAAALSIVALLCGLAACTVQPGADARATTRELASVEDRAYEVSVAWIGGVPAVAWHGGRHARDMLYIRYADADGRASGPVQQLTDGTRHAFEPSLQQFGGEALLAWYEQDDARHQVALLARFDADGNLRWRRELSPPTARGRNPVVRVAGDIAHVAWVEIRDGGAATLRWATVDAQGKFRQPPRDVGKAAADTWNLNAALDGEGGFHLVYDAGIEGRASELHWLRIHGEVIESRRITADDGHASVYPDLAIDGDRMALAWFDFRDGNSEVYLACARAGAADGFSQAHRVTHSPGESIGAYLAWREGRVELAWVDTDGQGPRLWRQRFDADCRALQEAQQVSTAPGAAGIPALAVAGGWLALAWTERRGAQAAVRGHNREVSSVPLLRILPPGV